MAMTPVKIAQTVGRGIDLASRKMVWVSALGVLAVFALVVIDVVGRYFFDRPVKGSNDIGELILVFIAYFAMAYTQLHKEHVRVTLVWSRLSPRGKTVGDGIAFLVGAAVWVLIAWNLSRRAWRLIAGTYPSTSETPVLAISHTPFVFVAVLGAVVFALLLVADATRAWAGLRPSAGLPSADAPAAPDKQTGPLDGPDRS